jgi:hypothetical protein
MKEIVMLRWLKDFLFLCILLGIYTSASAQILLKDKKLPESVQKAEPQNVKPGIETGSSETSENSLAKGEKSAYILTNQNQTRSTLAVASWDFTTGYDKYYGGSSGAKDLGDGKWGMIAGDCDGSGTVDANDRSEAWNDRNLTGYQECDCSLTGTVDANDRSMTWNNRNLTTSVP